MFSMCHVLDFLVEKQEAMELNMEWHDYIIMPFPETCKMSLQAFLLFLPLHENNADVAFEGGHKEMLADFVRQHAVIWEVEMASKNGHNRAVFCADKIQKLLRVGVGLVKTIFPP